MEEFKTKLEELKAKAAELGSGDLTPEVVAELKQIRDEINEVNAKIAAVTEAEALVNEIAETAVPEVKAEEPAEEPAAEATETETPEPVAEATDEVVEEKEEEHQPEAIAAAMNGIESKNDASPDADENRKGLNIIASSNYEGLRIGQALEVGDFSRISKIARSANEATAQKYGQIDLSEHITASVSSRNSAIENTLAMSKRTKDEPVSLTAAACFCGPFETMKEVPGLGSEERPVASIFRKVGVTGPFRYVNEVALADVLPGVNQWDCADQAAVDPLDPLTWKDCVDLACATETQVDPYAVVACGIASTHQELSHPELVDDFVMKLGINYARVAERLLLDTLRADATVLQHNVNGMGLNWELTRVLGHLPLGSTYNRRLDWENYEVLIPQGVMQLMVADELMRGFSMDEDRAQAKVMAKISQLGYGGVTIIRDVDATAEAGIAGLEAGLVSPGGTINLDATIDALLPNLPIYIVPTDAYTMGQSTIVEAGWRRDNQLIRQNQVEYFYEGMEFLEKMTNVPSFVVELTGGPNGGYSALTAPPAN